MRRIVGRCLTTAVLLAVPAMAQSPDELLDKAVKEQQQSRSEATPADARAATQFVSDADKLAEQRKFDEAIALYEKAYRLNPSDESGYHKLLIAKRAAGRMGEADHEALRVIESERDIRIDQIIRTIRLDILQAREALRTNDGDLAAAKVEYARAGIARLPRDVDVAIYRQELDRLAGRARTKTRQVRTEEPVKLSDAGQPPPPPPSETERVIVQEPYEPRGHIVEAALPPSVNDPSYRFQVAMEHAVRASRAEFHFGATRAQAVPRADITYPADWPERSTRRARYRDGEIYRGPAARGDDGQDYYTSVYDLGDLVHPVPNFYGVNPDPIIVGVGLADREWIRRRSMMFGGFAEDLAAGIPILHYYGGMDNWAVSPRYDSDQMDRVLRIIDSFLVRQEAKTTAPAPGK